MACTPDALANFSAAAKDEIGESAVNLEESVEILRQIVLESYPKLQLPPKANNILERCIRCRKFDLDRAAKQVHAFFKFLSDLYQMHNTMYFLPSIQPQFYAENFSADTLLAAIIMILEEVTKSSVDTQRIGIILLADLNGFLFSHAKCFTLSRIRACVKMVHGGFPARYKGIHIVRAPSIFVPIYAIIRPLLTHKIKNRLYLHGNDWTEFHKLVSPEILPKELGGKLSNSNSVDTEFTRRLCSRSRDEYYKDLFKYGYTQLGTKPKA